MHVAGAVREHAPAFNPNAKTDLMPLHLLLAMAMTIITMALHPSLILTFYIDPRVLPMHLQVASGH
jgi:hypothetical protein